MSFSLLHKVVAYLLAGLGLLALLLNLALGLRAVGRPGRRLYAGTAAVAGFAVLDELIQGFLPTRSLDALDLVANVLGLLMAEMACRIAARRRAAGGPGAV